LLKSELVSSRGECRRLAEEGAITELNEDKKIEDMNLVLEIGMQFRIGKKRFIKIV
jgi:tyrosyl-tRNA synthetase